MTSKSAVELHRLSILAAKREVQKAPAFFDPKSKTIHLRTDNITMGMLGHEIAHAVLADYFVIHPTHDIGEILSQHVEKKLTAQNFTVCISRTV